MNIHRKTMAEKKDQPLPLFELNEEGKEKMKQVEAQLQAAKQRLKDMQDLGLDVSRLEDKIAWGEKALKVLTKRME